MWIDFGGCVLLIVLVFTDSDLDSFWWVRVAHRFSFY
jgi:hypothetical protein